MNLVGLDGLAMQVRPELIFDTHREAVPYSLGSCSDILLLQGQQHQDGANGKATLCKVTAYSASHLQLGLLRLIFKLRSLACADGSSTSLP